MNMSTTSASSPSSSSPQNQVSAIPTWKKRLPMQLTWSRMAVCPLLVALLMLEGEIWGWIAALVFIAASITDWFDGWLARKWNAQSNMGKFMDPIADKILVAAALVMLIPGGRVHPVLVLTLLARDLLIGGIRSAAAADMLIIDAKPTGKWKTGIQMIAIPAVLINSSLFGIPVSQIGVILLWVSVVLSLISGYEYVQLYYESRKKKALAAQAAKKA